MTNEVDRLMDLDPLELSAQDIDSIIDYQRKQRAYHEAGIKPKKDKPSVSLDNVMSALTMTVAAEPIKRRV